MLINSLKQLIQDKELHSICLHYKGVAMSGWRGFRMFYNRVLKVEINKKEMPLEPDIDMQQEIKESKSKNKTALFFKYKDK